MDPVNAAHTTYFAQKWGNFGRYVHETILPTLMQSEQLSELEPKMERILNMDPAQVEMFISQVFSPFFDDINDRNMDQFLTLLPPKGRDLVMEALVVLNEEQVDRLWRYLECFCYVAM